MSDKIFVGSGKEFGQYGSINISVCLTDLPKEHITTGKKGKKYINLVVNKKRQADQLGKTHSVEVNTFKPEKKQENNLPDW